MSVTHFTRERLKKKILPDRVSFKTGRIRLVEVFSTSTYLWEVGFQFRESGKGSLRLRVLFVCSPPVRVFQLKIRVRLINVFVSELGRVDHDSTVDGLGVRSPAEGRRKSKTFESLYVFVDIQYITYDYMDGVLKLFTTVKRNKR